MRESTDFAALICSCSHVAIQPITETNWLCVMAPLASAAFAEARLQVVALPGGVTEGIVELVARFPPPWTVEDIDAAFVGAAVAEYPKCELEKTVPWQ